MSIQTNDDVNSNNLMNTVNNVCIIDTSLISMNEFSIVCEFCEISHVFNNGEHLFVFENITGLWNGKYYIIPSDQVMSDFNVSYSNSVLEVSCFSSSIVLMLYLCEDTNADFEFKELYAYPYDKLIYINNDLTKNIQFHVLDTGEVIQEQVSGLSVGWNSITIDSKDYGCVLCIPNKTDLIFDLTSVQLLNGVINHVQLNVDERYLPYAGLVDGDELDVLILYDNNELPVNYDSSINDYCFDIDLREKYDEKPVNLNVIVNESENINAGAYNFDLPCNYESITTFEELKSLIIQGETIIRLNNDIVCNTDLFLYNDLYLLGNDCNIDLDGHTIVAHENIKVKFKSIIFDNGKPCILQKPGTELLLESCTFNNCSISDKYKGSVVSTLNDENISTTFNECIILNSPHSIWHGGSLTLTNSKARYNIFNMDTVDEDYSLLLTQYQGTVDITGNIFDIDYNTQSLCQEQVNLKFASTLICVSPITTVNGVLGEKLKDNNTLPLFGSSYNNASHIYTRYYYHSADECIIISPMIGFEDKSTCHCIVGDNRIYKDNVQITTVNSNSQNEIRKIRW